MTTANITIEDIDFLADVKDSKDLWEKSKELLKIFQGDLLTLHIFEEVLHWHAEKKLKYTFNGNQLCWIKGIKDLADRFVSTEKKVRTRVEFLEAIGIIGRWICKRVNRQHINRPVGNWFLRNNHCGTMTPEVEARLEKKRAKFGLALQGKTKKCPPGQILEVPSRANLDLATCQKQQSEEQHEIPPTPTSGGETVCFARGDKDGKFGSYTPGGESNPSQDEKEGSKTLDGENNPSQTQDEENVPSQTGGLMDKVGTLVTKVLPGSLRQKVETYLSSVSQPPQSKAEVEEGGSRTPTEGARGEAFKIPPPRRGTRASGTNHRSLYPTPLTPPPMERWQIEKEAKELAAKNKQQNRWRGSTGNAPVYNKKQDDAYLDTFLDQIEVGIKVQGSPEFMARLDRRRQEREKERRRA